MAVRSKVQVCSRLNAGVTVSKPAESIDVSVLRLLCRHRPMLITSREESLLGGCDVCVWVCLSVCDLEICIIRLLDMERGFSKENKLVIS